MKTKKYSLLRQLILLLSIIFFILITTYILILSHVQNMNQKYVRQLSDTTLKQIQEQSEQFYESMNHIATTMVYSPITYDFFMMNPDERVVNNENMSTIYLNTTMLESDIAGLYLFDSDMNIICGMGEERRKMDHLAEDLVKKEQMEFSDLLLTQTTGTPYYAMYFPVYDLENTEYGKFIGMSVFLLHTTVMEDMIKDISITDHAEVYLIDGKNQIVSSVNGYLKEFLDDAAMVSDADYFVQAVPLKIDGWQVVSRIPYGDMTKDSEHLYSYITLAYCVAFLMLGILLYYTYRKLVIPITQVDSFIKNIVANPDERMESKRRDEIGDVIHSLNRMLDEKEQMDSDMKSAQERVYETEIEKQRLQVLAYRNQINPHFLYNTFDCICAMAMYHDAEDVAEITQLLSQVFRYAVKGENIVTVEEEVNYIKEYAKIIEYRFAGKIQVHIDMSPAVRRRHMIKLILQPLIENAVFHGLERKIESGTVQVLIHLTEDHKISLLVEDDGCGMDEVMIEQILERLHTGKGTDEATSGIGLTNIYRRLKLFYGDDMSFSMESELDEGTKIQILIPDDVSTGGQESV